jgi:NAD(P)-dependent dehydrogenase (short-subunit alcohol dehydrogenase family)
VHGALGYSTDTPLAHMFQHARWARFADGADEIHQMRIAQRTIAAYKDHGSTRCRCERHRRPAPALRARGGGTIVATSSMAGLVPVPMEPIYAANKHAVVGLVRSLGPQLAPEGIRVQALCPSFADTPILGEGKALLEQLGFPILDVAEVVQTFVAMLDRGEPGECWFVIPGRASEPFGFRRAPGPRA